MTKNLFVFFLNVCILRKKNMKIIINIMDNVVKRNHYLKKLKTINTIDIGQKILKPPII